MQNKYLVGGRIGDLIHNLYVVSKLSSSEFPAIIEFETEAVRSKLYTGDTWGVHINKLLEELSPLLLQQSYIKEIKAYTGEDESNFINLNRFRYHPKVLTVPWTELLTEVYDLELPDSPQQSGWLTVEKSACATDAYWNDKVVIHRSPVSHRINPAFPWKTLITDVKKLGWTPIFVSNNPSEYDECGFSDILDFHKTTSVSEYANIIGSANLMIGNLSLPLALAHAIGTPRICEFMPVDMRSYQHETDYRTHMWYYLHNELNTLKDFYSWLKKQH